MLLLKEYFSDQVLPFLVVKANKAKAAHFKKKSLSPTSFHLGLK